MEWVALVAAVLVVLWVVLFLRILRPSHGEPVSAEVDDAVLDIILCSLTRRPEEWKIHQWRAVNEGRGVSVWFREKRRMAIANHLVATAEDRPVPRHRRDELWDALALAGARQIVEKFK